MEADIGSRYEIPRTVEFLRARAYTRVALQVTKPNSFLSDSVLSFEIHRALVRAASDSSARFLGALVPRRDAQGRRGGVKGAAAGARLLRRRRGQGSGGPRIRTLGRPSKKSKCNTDYRTSTVLGAL